MDKKTDTPHSLAPVLKLFKDPSEADLILSRLHSVSSMLNQSDDDPILDMVHNKVLEAIDWYERYCDTHGYEVMDADDFRD